MTLREKLIMINKRNIYKKYNKFISVQSIGQYWISQLKQFVPYSYFVQEIGFSQIAAWGLHSINWWFIHNPTIPTAFIIIFVVVKYYLFMLINWGMGWVVILSGLNKAQSDISAKDEHLNPVQVELFKTVESIAKAVGAESSITKL